jgi:phosphopantothenoylcysteine decarboxylase/phosphopantothenate--cysteine ligase
MGICGGIAAYKSCEIVRLLVGAGIDVHCILTKSGREFITPLTLQTLSKNPVYTEIFSLIEESKVGHISLASRADCVLVAPATANFMAKVSAGICDDLLSAVICAAKAPVVFAPSMNKNMWSNPIVKRNVADLSKLGYKFVGPSEGELACGDSGSGRLEAPQKIADFVASIIK